MNEQTKTNNERPQPWLHAIDPKARDRAWLQWRYGADWREAE